MPKSAAYEIELSGEERAELEDRAACYTLSFKQVQRARLVLYAAEGHTNREIAQRLDMNEEVVGRWRRRFHAERLEPFGRLVEQVMTSEPHASARTVYWIVDNGSSHAGRASIERLEATWQNLRLIHLPIHASWLNQIELNFSIVQRKALSPTASTRLMSSPFG